MLRILGVTSVLVLSFVAGGCKSQAEKCMDTTKERYDREVAACKDDACKAKAAKDMTDWMEACKSVK